MNQEIPTTPKYSEVLTRLAERVIAAEKKFNCTITSVTQLEELERNSK